MNDRIEINKLRKLVGRHYYEMIDFIQSVLKPKEIEKKQYGEVYTPLTLVSEMIMKLEQSYKEQNNNNSIFSNSNLKWFDPCVGIGNFMVVVYWKLMFGLKDEIKDKEKRKKHILTNMLYMSELNRKNTEIVRLIFDSNTYKLNLYEGDTLKLDIKNEWGLDGFDVIVGNPPYNNKQKNKGKRGGGASLWSKFIDISINKLIINKGYLLYVNPSGWRKPPNIKSKYNGLYNLMCKKNQLIYLSIHNTSDGIKTFNCGTRYDWYLIQKTKKYKTTIINDENNRIHDLDLDQFNFLPNYNFNIVKNILTNKDEDKCEIIFSNSSYETRKEWMSKVETTEFKYPCIHSTPKSGTRYYYSSINNKGHFNESKVIFGDSGINDSIIDINGDYGLTQHSIGIKIYNIEEGDNIKKAIETEKFKDILLSCSWSNYQIDYILFTYFKKDFWKEFI